MVLAELGDRISSAVRKMTKDMAGSTEKDKVLLQMLHEIEVALAQADVDKKIITNLINSIKGRLDFENVPPGFNKQTLTQTVVFQEIEKMLDPQKKAYQPVKGQPNVVMFVGLQGSGKTTTITKYALYYKRMGWKCALICADTFRAGAFDQLKQNATKIHVPFYGSYTEHDPVTIAKEGVDYFKKDKCDLIIIDTSGRHKQEMNLFKEMKQIHEAVKPDNVVFTMDSSIGQAARLQAAAFKFTVDVGSIIITKLDGSSSGGGALAAVAATKSPVIFIGTGEHFDKFERFSAHTFTKRLLGFASMETLLEKMRTTMDPEKGFNKESIMRFAQGAFTFRDMYHQLEQMNKMGSLSEIMSYLPMMKDLAKNEQFTAAGQARLKNFSVIMDSMTDEELDNPEILTKPRTEDEVRRANSRKRRIARGAGRPVAEIEDMLNNFGQMKKMSKPMSKLASQMGGPGGPDFSKLASQMGASGGNMPDMGNLMKQMGGGGGMPSMSSMASMLQGMGGGQMNQMMQMAQQMGLGGKQKKKYIRK
mmetsp:Transcript_11492/g.17011  ORF Transcript_11492/g.17011 Transcript_11492/m.17011 type:complete len:533 (+) Transcript_11492:158-1756(+)